MGACEIYDVVVSESVSKAWERLVRKAREYYGNDLYNGSWSTCDFIRLTKQFDGKSSKSKVSQAEKIIKKCFNNGEINKRAAYAIDCGIDHYSLLTVKKTKAKGRPRQSFVVFYLDDNGREREKSSFDNIKDAEVFASELAITGVETGIQRRYFYDNGETVVAYTPVERRLKSRPKKIPKGAKLIEYHVYYFYGLAAE